MKFNTVKIIKWTAAIMVLMVIMISGALLCLYQTNKKQSGEWLVRPAEPGRIVKHGNFSNYITVRGSGSPVVIIETAIGSASPEWWHIQNSLSGKTTVATYDRSGYGWSQPGPMPRSAEQAARELRSLLAKMSLQPPYILVGHDIGALYMLYFALTSPEQVAGLVLVDPFPVQYPRFREEIERAVYKNFIDKRSAYKIGGTLGTLGIVRWLKIVPYVKVPDAVRPLVIEAYSLEKTYSTAIAEFRKGLELTLNQLKDAGKTLQVPVVVIRHSERAYSREMKFFGVPVDEARKINMIWNDSYRWIARQSKQAKKMVAKNSTHNIHFDEPELIIRAVSDMLDRKL